MTIVKVDRVSEWLSSCENEVHRPNKNYNLDGDWLENYGRQGLESCNV